MKRLVNYARSKNVEVFLWYNSNGSFNDAPQGPKNKMNTSVACKAEMKWLKEIGVKGLKVDFFGGRNFIIRLPDGKQKVIAYSGKKINVKLK